MIEPCIEVTEAFAGFEREWRRVTGGEHATWPSAADPTTAETLREDGRGPPTRWSCIRGAGVLKAFPANHAVGFPGLCDVVRSLRASGAEAVGCDADEHLEAASEELTRALASGLDGLTIASMASGMGIAPSRLRIVVGVRS